MPFAKYTATGPAPATLTLDGPMSADALARHLANEADLARRAHLLAALVALASREAVTALTDLLHHTDPAVRSAGVEGLVRMAPDLSQPAIAKLLRDPSPDIRIRALDAVERVPDPQIETWLVALLDCEKDTNVCGVVLDLLADIGTQASVPAILSARLRFANAPFVAFAADLALSQIAEG